MIRIELPWPPSVNTYWRHPTTGKLAGRHLISKAGREYREVALSVLSGSDCVRGRLAVRIMAYPPDRRRRDLDNILKPVLDALQHGGVIEDDENIDKLEVIRAGVQPGDGSVLIFIEAIGGCDD